MYNKYIKIDGNNPLPYGSKFIKLDNETKKAMFYCEILSHNRVVMNSPDGKSGAIFLWHIFVEIHGNGQFVECEEMVDAEIPNLIRGFESNNAKES